MGGLPQVEGCSGEQSRNLFEASQNDGDAVVGSTQRASEAAKANWSIGKRK